MSSSSSPTTDAKATGSIVLIGAGPGDVELLTLKAARALGEADVALVDDAGDRAAGSAW